MKQTPPADVSHLLRARYKVILDYPHNRYEVGDIIHEKEIPQITEQMILRYPHIFKPLAWYEEREPSEMPEYVKIEHYVNEGKFQVYKIGVDCEHDFFDKKYGGGYFGLKWKSGGGTLSRLIFPATQSEYETYINKTK